MLRLQRRRESEAPSLLPAPFQNLSTNPATTAGPALCVGGGARLGAHMKTLRYYWGAYKLSRINNTRIGALREMLFTPF